jgi:hypothetical protein
LKPVPPDPKIARKKRAANIRRIAEARIAASGFRLSPPAVWLESSEISDALDELEAREALAG